MQQGYFYHLWSVWAPDETPEPTQTDQWILRKWRNKIAKIYASYDQVYKPPSQNINEFENNFWSWCQGIFFHKHLSENEDKEGSYLDSNKAHDPQVNHTVMTALYKWEHKTRLTPYKHWLCKKKKIYLLYI